MSISTHPPAIISVAEGDDSNAFEQFDQSLRLFPSSTLKACDGFDVTHKSSRTKDDILMILPVHIALNQDNQQGILGYLDMDDASNPVFILETEGGSFSFKGRYVSSSSTILPVYANPKKKEMTCNKAINQLIVFDEPSFEEKDGGKSELFPEESGVNLAASPPLSKVK